MPSKAQGLSLNTIVIAAIVLIVLLILIGLTTGYLGKWKGKFNTLSDTSCKGSVVDYDTPCGSNEKESSAAVPVGKKCCMNVGCDTSGGKCCDAARCVGGSYLDGKLQCGEQVCCAGSCT